MSSSLNDIMYPASKKQYRFLLERNPEFVVVKVGSQMCSPCKKITPFLTDAFHQLDPARVSCISLDMEASVEIFDYLKEKGVITTIPTLLLYNKGNASYIPDRQYSGADVDKILEIIDTLPMMEVPPSS